MDFAIRAALAVSFSLALNLLFRYSPAKRHEQPMDGTRELKYPLGLLLLSVLCLTIGSLALLAFFHGQQPLESGGLGVTFGAMGLYVLVERRARVLLHSQGFQLFSPWGSDTFVSWSQISSVRHSSFNNCFTIDTGGTRVRISTLFVGIDFFIGEMVEHVEQSIWETALHHYGRGWTAPPTPPAA